MTDLADVVRYLLDDDVKIAAWVVHEAGLSLQVANRHME